MASLLDPTMKGGVGIPNMDKEFVWEQIRDRLVHKLQQREEEAQAQPRQQNNNHMELPFNPANQPPDMDLMFADLCQYYRQEHQQHEQQQINGEYVINKNKEHQQHLNMVLVLFRFIVCIWFSVFFTVTLIICFLFIVA
jgi:hypothetical protein